MFLKTSSRYNCKTCSWRCLEDVLKKTSWKHVLKTSWRRFLEDVLQTRLEDILKTSPSRLGRRNIVTLKTFSRHLQDVLENKKCLLGHALTSKVSETGYGSSNNFKSTNTYRLNFISFRINMFVLVNKKTNYKK